MILSRVEFTLEDVDLLTIGDNSFLGAMPRFSYQTKLPRESRENRERIERESRENRERIERESRENRERIERESRENRERIERESRENRERIERESGENRERIEREPREDMIFSFYFSSYHHLYEFDWPQICSNNEEREWEMDGYICTH